MVLAGDFKRILPIVRKANQPAQICACVKFLRRIWDLFANNQCYLTKNMHLKSTESVSEIVRIQEFPTFMKMLGMDELQLNVEGNIYVPDRMVEPHFKSEYKIKHAITDYVYGDVNE